MYHRVYFHPDSEWNVCLANFCYSAHEHCRVFQELIFFLPSLPRTGMMPKQNTTGTKDLIWTCEFCNKSFKRKYGLSRHRTNRCKILFPRTGEYKCGLCDWRSNSPPAIYQHAKRAHINGKLENWLGKRNSSLVLESNVSWVRNECFSND